MDKSFPTENGSVDCPKTTTAQLGYIPVYEAPLLAIDALGGRRVHNMFDSLVSLFYRDRKTDLKIPAENWEHPRHRASGINDED